jgi:hypothetical protein
MRETKLANDCVHLRAGCKERDGSKNRNAGPSSATLCSPAVAHQLGLDAEKLQHRPALGLWVPKKPVP